VASLFPPCLGVGRGVGETLAGMMRQTGISSRYWAHCSSGLRFSCRAWKPCGGSPAPRLVPWRGGGGVAALFGWMVCCSGWAAFPGGPVWTV